MVVKSRLRSRKTQFQLRTALGAAAAFTTQMRLKLRIALSIPLAALLGCGASPTLSPSPSTSLSLTGNWMILGTPNPSTRTLPSPIADFVGALASANGAVAGVVRAFDDSGPLNPCVSLTQDLPVIGTLDTANNLSLTVPLSGGIATITATLPQNLHTFIPGSYQIVGGPCAMPATPMIISQFASATGTYAGTFNVIDTATNTSVPGTATAVTATLTQSSSPNADGQFPLAGTIAAAGACTASLVFTNALVSGDEVIAQPLAGPSSPEGIFNGAIDPTATTLIGAFDLLSTCNYQIYQGTLTRQ